MTTKKARGRRRFGSDERRLIALSTLEAITVWFGSGDEGKPLLECDKKHVLDSDETDVAFDRWLMSAKTAEDFAEYERATGSATGGQLGPGEFTGRRLVF